MVGPDAFEQMCMETYMLDFEFEGFSPSELKEIHDHAGGASLNECT